MVEVTSPRGFSSLRGGGLRRATFGVFFEWKRLRGAGIIVRNSIILVDFIELRRAQGMSLEDPVVDASVGVAPSRLRESLLRVCRIRQKGNTMTVERYLRLIAGAFILGSLALGNWVDPCWYLFTGFVGLNLLQ